MGRPRVVLPVKLFCGLLSADADLLGRARQLLGKRYGPVDLESPTWPFTQSDYYRDEMGPELLRRFVSFERLARPEDLAAIKLHSNEIESRMADDCALLDVSRPVNIDPGYVDLAKVVLATTKDRSHRICIGQRIFAEVTLYRHEGTWQASPWTYADYREPHYHEFFTRLRDRLHEQRRLLGTAEQAEPEPGA